MFDEQRIGLVVEDVEAVADELQGLLVRDADVAGMGERLNGLAMTAVEDLLDGRDTSAVGAGMGGNFPELLEGWGRVLASGLGKFDVDLVTGTFGPPTESADRVWRGAQVLFPPILVSFETIMPSNALQCD